MSQKHNDGNFLVSIVFLIIIVVVITLILKKKIKPIKRIVNAAEQIANGNFNVASSKENYYKGNYKEILTSITNMKQNLNQRLSDMMQKIS